MVEETEKKELFKELFRVLKKGGRAVISDIVSDEEIPQHLKDDPDLWSGCISGAYTEKGFIEAFTEAGFYGVEILSFQKEAWQTVEGIEFRSVTIQAYKGKEGKCFERNQAVIYKGPFSCVEDDDNHYYERGQRVAVCDKTYNILKNSSYSENFEFIEPINEIPLEKAQEFDCSRTEHRHPKETKGHDYKVTKSNDVCDDEGCCC